jgi:hypothetical protein
VCLLDYCGRAVPRDDDERLNASVSQSEIRDVPVTGRRGKGSREGGQEEKEEEEERDGQVIVSDSLVQV